MGKKIDKSLETIQLISQQKDKNCPLCALGKTVDDVIADGPGLVFVVFPHALAKMPVPQLW